MQTVYTGSHAPQRCRAFSGTGGRAEVMPALVHPRGRSSRSLAALKREHLRGNSFRFVAAAAAVEAAELQAEDKWIARTLAPLNSSAVPSSLKAINSSSLDTMRTLRMPTTRNEEYRFTDISPLLKATLQMANGNADISQEFVAAHHLPEAKNCAVVVNGVLRPELSSLTNLPEGVYVGSIQGAPAEACAKMGSLAKAHGGPFSVINGMAARDALAVVVPEGIVMEAPLHVMYLSTGGSNAYSTSAPRLLVHAAPHSAVEIIEEYMAADASGLYFSCGVAELFLDEHSQVKHGYVEREHNEAIHIKSTLVEQAAESQYSLTEARAGGRLSRHDVGVQQSGPDTETHLRHFLICGSSQLHDLHTKLELNHPRGVAAQVHKCIAAHSSARGVFDGNVKVNKLAQKTDAQQLSRNLLLVPRATVNVKPNLQIIADDVKCTHGCSVSDLRDDELFYFRARGIDADTARRALVASFGAEVTQCLESKTLVQRVQTDVSKILASADISAAMSSPDAVEDDGMM